MVQLYGRAGGETLVNTTTDGAQSQPAMARLASGQYVVVWVSQSAAGPEDFEIVGQLYAASGTPIGGEFKISGDLGNRGEPRVSALSTGGFVVTWSYDVHDGSGVDAASGFAFRIKGQLFDSAAAKVGGELAITSGTSADHFDSQVIGLANGGFAVSWLSHSLTNGVDDFDTVVRLFNGSGAATTAVTNVTASSIGFQANPALAALPGGGFVAAWTDTASAGVGDSSGSGVKAQLFNAAGAKVGAAFLVNTTTTLTQGTPSIATLASGGFVVTWADNSKTGGDTSGQAVRGQIFNAAGAKVGGEFLVNSTTAGDQFISSVSALPNGGFVVAWRDGTQTDADIRAQVFDAAGAKVGIEFLVNTVIAGRQNSPAMLGLADGSFVAAWEDAGGSDGSLSGVKVQLFAPNTGPATDVVLSSTTLGENAVENEAVATVAAVGAANSTYSYELIADSSGGAFRLEGDKLVIDDNAKLDFETAPQVTVTIRATDINSQTHDEAIVLDVTDVVHERRYSAGDEFLANVTEAGLQGGSTVVPLVSGGFAMLWFEYNPANPSPNRTLLRLYDADGVPVSGEIVLAEKWVQGMQVVPLADGGFLIVREAYHEPSGTFSIKAQAYDSSGSPHGAEMIAGSTQSGFPHGPSAVQLASGGFAISWATPANVVVAQLFAPNGTPFGGTKTITSSFEDLPISLAARPSGGFAAGWVEGGVGGDPYVLKAQLYGPSGTPFGAQLSVDGGTLGVGYVTLLALADGSYMLTWTEAIGDIDGFPVIAVMAQPIDMNGAAVGDPVELAVFAQEPDFSPSISFAAHPSGGFIAMWPMIDFSTGAITYNFLAQLFDSCGCPIGSLFHPTEIGEGGDVAILADGMIVTTWTGFDSSDRGVLARLFRPADEPFDNSGNDILMGDMDANLLDGGAGNDQLYGLGGNDDLRGGTGNDWLRVSGTGIATADGGADFDYLAVDYAAATTDIIMGYPNVDPNGGLIGSLGDGGARRVDYSSINIFDIRTGSGNDVVYGGENGSSASLGGGDDRFWGAGGFETVDGGAGIDGVSAGLGLAVTAIVWNLATNSYSGPIGSYTNFEYFLGILTGSANDTIVTTSSNLDDTLSLGSGNDSATVANGHDTVNGEFGTDLLIIDYSGATASVSTTGGAAGLTPGSDLSGVQGQIGDGGARRVDFNNIDRFDVRTGSGNDNIATAGGNDEIRTGGGSDVLSAGGGNDLLDGGSEADAMTGGAGSDIYVVDNAGDTIVENAGEGLDEVRTSLAAYSLLGTNIERLTAISGAAHDFRGSAFNNVIAGAAGNDFLRLQDGGIDTASGGGGDDVFLFGAAMTGADVVDGGTGTDQIALQGNYAGANALTFGMGVLAIENLAILPGNDTRFGDPGTNFYDYNVTTRDLNVASGVQMIVDAARLRVGEDFTFNGSAELDGSFFIYGGGGTDLLTGGAKNDLFLFGAQGQWGASDVVNGGPGGIDQLALRGDYVVTFGAAQLIGIEQIGLVSAFDMRFGALGDAYDYNLTMNDANVAGIQFTVDASSLRPGETLVFNGSAEDDGSFRIFAGRGNDTIIGSQNGDFIQGNGGLDTLTGGGGADIFRYLATSDSTTGAVDRILGFTPGTDKIDLSRIDADSFAAGDQTFHWIGSNAFGAAGAASAGELRAYQNGGSWFVQGDVNGDGIADLVIELVLQGPTPLGAGDFLP